MIEMALPDGRTIAISHPVMSSRIFSGDRLVQVRLYGRLAIVAGCKMFEMAVSSVRESITALHHLTNGRTTRYIDETLETVRWKVLVNGHQIDGDSPGVADELMIERDGIETIDIYPVPEGAANWLGMIFGVILLVVGIVFAVWGGAALLPTAIGMIISGVAGILGGLMSLFEKPSSTPKQKKSQGNPSYLFSGTVNTQDQGGPVPLAYGHIICGSQCIAAFVTNSDVYTAPLGGGDWQVGTPFTAKDNALRAQLVARQEADVRAGVQPLATTPPAVAATTIWNDLGSQNFWGYVAQVVVVPYAYEVSTQQTPHPYPAGPWWLFRSYDGALWATYETTGNLGPWECLRTLPQEVDPIVLTHSQDQYIGWAATPNIP